MSFPTPSEIEIQYLQILKSIKPSININDQNSDFVIRGKTITGIVSGIYGDQEKVNNDTYISSARPEGLLLHGQDFAISRQPATQARSPQARITGTNGTVINPGDLTFLYVSTNVLYTNLTGGIIGSGILDLSIQCSVAGQIGNVASPDSLQVVSPPAGIDALALVIQSISDGSDIETFDSYRARLLSRKQSPPAGGNETDYYNFAFASDPSVRSASIKRFGRGLGTVDVYITTGTTDVDTAVTQGLPIVRVPSSLVLQSVQDYYDQNVPLTDCPRVYAPTEILVDVTVKVVLASGLTLASVPGDTTYNPLMLTVGQIIAREVGRALYKVPVGGRKLNPSTSIGYVVSADIEESLDTWISAVTDPSTGFVIGRLPLLDDRQVQPLDAPNINLEIIANQIVAPGVITIIEGV